MPKPLTVDEYVDITLDRKYKETAGKMLSQIQYISTNPASKMQIALRDLDDEVAKLTENQEKLPPENIPLKNALKASLALYLTTAALVNQNAVAIQNSGQTIAIPAVTAKVFINVSSSLITKGINPLSPAAMASYQKAIKKTSVGFVIPKTLDFVEDFVDSPAWIAKMEKWGTGYAQLTRNAIVQGIADGQSPRFIANTLREMAQNIPYSGAENLTRTLQLTSYRESSLAMESINGGFIIKKVRIAHLDDSTCLSCISLHGTELEVGERVDDHYRGRCSEFYVVPGGDEFPEFMQADSTRGNRVFVPFQTGESWFASLSPERQAKQASFMNTPAKYNAYKSGVPLSAFVGDHEDKVFGPQKIELSLVKALGSDAENHYVKNQ